MLFFYCSLLPHKKLSLYKIINVIKLIFLKNCKNMLFCIYIIIILVFKNKFKIFSYFPNISVIIYRSQLILSNFVFFLIGYLSQVLATFLSNLY